jgi:hypothetical protein
MFAINDPPEKVSRPAVEILKIRFFNYATSHLLSSSFLARHSSKYLLPVDHEHHQGLGKEAQSNKIQRLMEKKPRRAYGKSSDHGPRLVGLREIG